MRSWLSFGSPRNSSLQRMRKTNDEVEEIQPPTMIKSSSKSSRRCSLDNNSSSTTETSMNSSMATTSSCSNDCNRSSLITSSSKTLDLGTDSQGSAMALTSHGLLLNSASSSGKTSELKLVSVTDFSTRSLLFSSSSSSPVKSLLATSEEQDLIIYTSHEDLKIRVWRMRMNPSELQSRSQYLSLTATLPTLTDSIFSLMLPDSHIKTRRHRKTLRIQHHDSISALALTPDRSILFSGSWDRTIKAWRTRDFKCVDSFQAHSDAVNCLLFSSDGHLFSASSDGEIKVWELDSAESKLILISSLNRHQRAVNSLALSPDEECLYSASADKRVIEWEREDSANFMSESQVLKGHRGSVLCVSAAKSAVCSGCEDGTVRIWKRGSASLKFLCVGSLGGYTGPVKSINVHDSDNFLRIWSRSLGGVVKTWLIELHCSDDDSDMK